MAKKDFNIRKNKDGTIRVKVGRQVEIIDTVDKEKSRIFDEVRYALISKDVYLSEAKVAEILWDL